ncbi:alpha/beta hydrolase [Chitinophaga varians]|uniref:Alpha/beta hydrolase n=1 Tax=Chitinophaga varians TaxID=2202339 RepID=A0A847RV58_9BACT|nr:alpha/beta hydrolase [Chitinophaga varians]NLR66963.1 alpha/beta hydrolase [Chitinophaga varians]
MQTYNRQVNANVQAYLESVNSRHSSTPATLEAFRQATLDAMPVWSGEKTPLYQVLQQQVNTHVSVAIYRPGPGILPAVLYFHGGGWVRGSVATHDWLCRNLAAQSGAIVVSVEYRLSPEHVFPAALDDGYDALLWLMDNAASLDIDAQRIAIGGDSSGGNIAIATLLRARDAGIGLAAQLLVYPPVEARFDTGSYNTYAEGYHLTRQTMQQCWQAYTGQEENARHPLAAVVRNDFRGLPPALIIAAECDPLRDDGRQLAGRYREDGVVVRYSLYPGTIHPFFLMPALLPEAREAQREAALFLRDMLQ